MPLQTSTTPWRHRNRMVHLACHLAQIPETQLDGVALDRVFIDQVSGKDASRPQLEAALAYVREGDTLVVHSMHRLARNLEDLRRPVRSRMRAAVSLSASLAPCSRGVGMGRDYWARLGCAAVFVLL
ncbi:recombinase family protein [Mycobacteroides abscessus]|uniref:recombinase family protein n=1 Tax=Mycobacteroides abscessus TaxID=36809 RepID=UPI00094435A6